MLHNSLLLRKVARWRRKITRATITSLIIAVVILIFYRVLNDAISGIIGNAAYYVLLPSLWDKLIQSIKANGWPWFVTGVAIIIALGFFFQTLSLNGAFAKFREQ